jgi:hypothetical protein
MTITINRLVEIAQEVAGVVRDRIPRSANRFLDTDATNSDWLKNTYEIPYTEFIQTFVRTGTKGPGQVAIKQRTKEPVACCFSKTVSRDATIRQLKDAVLDFLQNGSIDGQTVDLNYKPGKDAEKAYSAKFAAALAAFLNQRGLRAGKERFTARTVLGKIQNQLRDNDRLGQALGRSAADAFVAIHGRNADRTLQFPPHYIAASARNALKFHLGNCEECACTTFAFLLTFKRADGTRLAALAEDDRVKVELIQARSVGDSHFFVLLNRPGTTDIFDDFPTWFANPKVVACDPWITDTGAGGRITSEEMADLRDYLKPLNKDGPEFLAVRATGYLGQVPEGFKEKASFRLPDA